ncbi:GntR family transcriptional regulator [Lacrimispora indolis]|uniref:GntR family transcriptional regulator n=1 Tax=Lacrimispora indolis TaxID=69825 RepID=UPI00041EF37C|nr:MULTISPECIES: GntR family transcriptional regulator [Lachnospiraceae]MBE7720724.1 GntR family transcriptional regulator [Lacrimispora celerecrescens]
MKFEFIQIDKYSPVPLYEQLKACLIKAIRNGTLTPGQKLPTEEEICLKFAISRPVVRQAYGELDKLGLLERKRGSGSFVKSNTDRGVFLMQLVSYNEELAMIGMKAGTDLKKKEVAPYHAQIYEKLRLEPQQHCLHLERMRYADKRPFTYIENFVPLDLFPGIENHDYGTESLYHIMKDVYGIYPARAVRSIRAEIIDPAQARLFHIEKGSPVHMLESTAYDQYDRPIDYSIETYPGNTHRFDFVVYRE